jgi:hypothetical protein
MFDHRGTLVSKSKSEAVLRTLKKVLHVDSGDRDITKYMTNGDIVVYLPRVYERIVSIRLMSADFPSLSTAFKHPYSKGANAPTGNFSSDALVSAGNGFYPGYFLIDIEGLNKTDETAIGANGSGISDAFFGKIVVRDDPVHATTTAQYGIQYNDHSAQENIANYSPPIGKLDRLHIRLRTHDQQYANAGFMYWVNQVSSPPAPTTSNATGYGADYSMTFEIEYLDNGFDDFSSMETRLRDRP